jgi:hypothetical protein
MRNYGGSRVWIEYLSLDMFAVGSVFSNCLAAVVLEGCEYKKTFLFAKNVRMHKPSLNFFGMIL